jgi:hypothetical protein
VASPVIRPDVGDPRQAFAVAAAFADVLYPVTSSATGRSMTPDLGTRLQLGAQSAHAEHRFVRVSLERSVVTASGA